MYKVELTKSAVKELSKLPPKEAIQITEKIKTLEDNPRPRGCIKLSGNKEEYRIRSGNYRILYTIEDTVLFVQVIRVGNRKDVY